MVSAPLPDRLSSVLTGLLFHPSLFLAPGSSLNSLNSLFFKLYPSLSALPFFSGDSPPGGPHFRRIRL